MTCEVVVIDDPNGQDLVKKTKKRKRGSSKSPQDLGAEEKEAKIELFRKELDGLFGYYREVMSQRGCFDLKQECGNNMDLKSVIGALMEESGLPLSKLVDQVFQKVKSGYGDVTLATVKKIVLLVGQREMYGVPNADADVLEDDSDSCLWCWETRDVKLMPASVRGVLNIRRTCRRKINERITAVSAMIMALQKPESDKSYIHDLMKASEMIDKASCEAKIRSLMDRLSLKNSADMVKKEAKREDKLQIKQMERDKREAEKEKQRLERERQKEEMQNEKEQKWLLEESEKLEKRREKEESEIRKLRRKQQEDAEKEQRRREKEEAKLKDQLSIKKQASIMDRFLKRTKSSPACQNDQLPTKGTVSISSSMKDENLSDAVTQSMDHTLSTNDKFSAEDIRRLHLSTWRNLGHSIRSNRNQSWGIRRKPKIELFKELKLTTSKGLVHGDDSMEKLVDRWGESVNYDRSCHVLADVKKFKSRKQLLQFDKSHRPAFYGIWSKRSHVVGPCHPLRKDPDLDYDIDSDEDWEEEDPGESLSDCDKEDEGESLEEGCSKADDEDESEDGFFVPDGYLSENEGVEVDRMEIDISCEETKSPSCKQDSESDKFSSLFRQQKYLGNLTERALQKNQPLIISNLMHEKASLLIAQDLSGTPKMEQMCLQALSMHVFPGDSLVEISVDGMQEEDPEVYMSTGKCSIKSSSAVAVIPESDLPAIVSVIQSCSHAKVKKQIVLDGPVSSGKSTALAMLVHWAREEGWLVLYVPRGKDWTHGGFFYKNPQTGLWDTPVQAENILKDFLKFNESRLKQLLCQISDHIPLGEGAGVGWMKDGIDSMAMPEGSTLYDLVDTGIKHTHAAVGVVVRLRKELSLVKDIPVLIAIDQYNNWFTFSEYEEAVTVRSTRPIHAKELATVKAFRSMIHDDMMVGAFSHSTAVGKLRQDLPDVPSDARMNLPRYTLDEAAAVCHYYLRQRLICREAFSEENCKRIYYLSNGNGAEMRWLATFMREQ